MSLLHELLSPLGFNTSQQHDIFHCMKKNQSGKIFHSSQWTLLRDRDMLILQKKDFVENLPQLQIEKRMVDSDFTIPRDREIACIDADKVKESLVIRKWRQGDKFVPLGMTGKKMVSDYLSDRKFTLFQKENQWVVCDGQDIVWLVNERCDNRYRVTDKTRNVLLLRVTKEDDQ